MSGRRVILPEALLSLAPRQYQLLAFLTINAEFKSTDRKMQGWVARPQRTIEAALGWSYATVNATVRALERDGHLVRWADPNRTTGKATEYLVAHMAEERHLVLAAQRATARAERTAAHQAAIQRLAERRAAGESLHHDERDKNGRFRASTETLISDSPIQAVSVAPTESMYLKIFFHVPENAHTVISPKTSEMTRGASVGSADQGNAKYYALLHRLEDQDAIPMLSKPTRQALADIGFLNWSLDEFERIARYHGAGFVSAVEFRDAVAQTAGIGPDEYWSGLSDRRAAVYAQTCEPPFDDGLF